MKSIVPLLAILLSTSAYAQSNYHTNVMDNPYGIYESIYELPWDQSQLIQVKKEFFSSPQFHAVYTFETISNEWSSPYYIPFCADISSEPFFLDDGVLVTGTTPLNGIECVFFDGTNVVEFDLNVGSGDSDPIVSALGEQIFIIGNDGNARQLYEFDKINHTVTKITNSPIDINEVCAGWGDDIYYSTIFENTAFSQDEYALIKASLNNGTYSHATVQTLEIPFGVERNVYWNSPVVKWNKLFLVQGSYSFVNAVLSDLKVISIDDNGQVEVVHQMAQTDKNFIKLFEWDDALWTYVESSNELYVCRDAASFAQDINAGTKLISNHFVTSNGKLFLDLYIPGTDNQEIAAHYGVLQTMYTGNHMHFLMEEDEVLYLSDWKWYDSSSIVLIHTAFDGVEDIYIDQAGDHSPVRNASLIHNGEFTFMFAYDYADISVLKLTGSPSSDVEEVQLELTTFPNPVGVGEPLTLRVLRDGEVQLINSTGNLLKQLVIVNGEAQLDTSFLSPGVYFISFMNHTRRVVVK